MGWLNLWPGTGIITGNSDVVWRFGSGLKRLAAIFGSGPGSAVGQLVDGPRPEHAVAVIGDIHGRVDLLENLLKTIGSETTQFQIVFVGDYVDRGPDSRAVLDLLRHRIPSAVCLLGNHEVMLLEFLNETLEKGGRWLRHGGFATLASYGIQLGNNPTTAELEKARGDFADILADGTLDWLKACPLFWQSGDLVVSHAGLDPKVAVLAQDDRDLIWGHNRFLRDDRNDGLWVAHGHWVRDQPTCANRRINVDTGAWKTGVLTAAIIDPDGTVRFLSAR